MNFESDKLDNNLLYIGFNQDQGCFACGMQDGFCIFNTDPLKLKQRQVFDDTGDNGLADVGSGVGHVEMLFRCNYLAFLGGGKRPRVGENAFIIYDDLRKKVVVRLDFDVPVKAVKLRRDRIVAVLDDYVEVYTFTHSPKKLHVFQTASPNSRGLCALSPNSNRSTLAFPAPRTGCVHVVDLAQTEKAPLEIAAHQSTLSCISMNMQGTRLATSSEKGTLIRIFDTVSGHQLQELRRGLQNASIYSLNFNSESSLICLSSDHGTVHVFSLLDGNDDDGSSSKHKNKHSNLAPASSVVKYFGSQWSCSRIQVPSTNSNNKCVCAFGSDPNSIIVLCTDGFYYKYVLTDKGEAILDTRTQFL